MKCIIFSEFAEVCKIIHKEYPKSLMVIGETPQDKRFEIINKFNESSEHNILIASKALEMGANIQSADLVIHYDPPLTYSSYDQRCSRARRQGRKDKVISVRLVCNNTIESKIYKLIERKKEVSLMAMPYNDLIKELI